MDAVNYQGLDISQFVGLNVPTLQGSDEPELSWIDIDNLVVDTRYQRPIAKHGRNNVIKIAFTFNWRKFSTVIVCRIEDGRLAIIDGQHRCTAAKLIGITRVPCQIVSGDLSDQASAFADINGTVTAMTSLHLYQAGLTAGDPRIVRLNAVLAKHGVTVCRYPVPANKMKAGETLAPKQLQTLLDRYGDVIFGNALSCITCTRDGNPGMLRALVVRAYCEAIKDDPKWRGTPLIASLQDFNLRRAYLNAARDRLEGQGQTWDILSDVIGAHIQVHFRAAA